MKTEEEIRSILNVHKQTLLLLKEMINHSIVGFDDVGILNSMAKESLIISWLSFILEE